MSATSGQRMAPYCSATLGRPRQTDLKRAEPNIYSQVIPMIDSEIDECLIESTDDKTCFISGYSTKV